MSRLLPLFGFLGLVALFAFGIWWNTQHDQNAIPTPLLNKPAPAFDLPQLYEPTAKVSKADLLGKPYLLNVFASWCIECGLEHPVLEAEGPTLGVELVGYNYKDAPADAKRWLAEHGNPYKVLLADESGQTAINFGVYGAPESFLIDAQGVIRYKHIGPLTPDVVANELKPAIASMLKEAR
ncbi:MAG: DsbE family thiol:disulfide interchange protein [Pseudomonadota bacterium]|jgi:cytochrome c biogenesis protein CcmG/thiol:disulfide interchange protein DsbE|nr:DsbE family thiol:disulfide interchange protein [Xanthomonadaceae bacterium]MDE2248971.1 DsbE family thiol:disulfide interchange protein [Xanthomonadaceae bacterium]MDE3211563.1 DsbE family thiol:disulfide interchange protein [Pseudomonadota bacterium]